MRGRRWLIAGCATLLVGSVVAVLVLASGRGPKRFETAAFSFSYPEDWEVVEGVDFPLAAQYGREEARRAAQRWSPLSPRC